MNKNKRRKNKREGRNWKYGNKGRERLTEKGREKKKTERRSEGGRRENIIEGNRRENNRKIIYKERKRKGKTKWKLKEKKWKTKWRRSKRIITEEFNKWRGGRKIRKKNKRSKK